MENIIEIEKDIQNILVSQDEARAKTSLKMHYEAQAAVIERQLEGLKGVRAKLGLSQRKMAQLLMVDPSAWTRWNRPGQKPPPLVLRALQWYMILQEKIPGLTPNYFLGFSPDVVKAEAFREIRKESQAREELAQKLAEFESKIQGFKSRNDQLMSRVSDLERKIKIWRLGAVILCTVLLSWLVKAAF